MTASTIDSADVYKPPYMPWYEGDFWASLRVRCLSPLARLMLRSLLQQSWRCDSPGYLPADDHLLMTLADAPSREEWERNRDSVLRMLKLTADGQFYFHPKAIALLAKVTAEHEARKRGGKTGGRNRPATPELKVGNSSANSEHGLSLSNSELRTHNSETDKNSCTAIVLPPSKRGTRLPETFAVTEEHREFARKKGLPNPDAHIDEFRDHFRAKAGAEGCKLDWDATFRNWLRRAPQFKRAELMSASANRSRPTDAAFIGAPVGTADCWGPRCGKHVAIAQLVAKHFCSTDCQEQWRAAGGHNFSRTTTGTARTNGGA